MNMESQSAYVTILSMHNNVVVVVVVVVVVCVCVCVCVEGGGNIMRKPTQLRLSLKASCGIHAACQIGPPFHPTLKRKMNSSQNIKQVYTSNISSTNTSQTAPFLYTCKDTQIV